MKNDLSKNPKYRYYKMIRNDGFGQFKTVPYSRRLAIRYYCMECVGFSPAEVSACTESQCPLYLYRFGDVPENRTSQDRAKAIRMHCLECTSDDKDYIAECPSPLCPTHPYRLAGYKTDTQTLIPSDKLAFLPEYEEGFEDSEEKTAV
jgi:hypothetical protein